MTARQRHDDGRWFVDFCHGTKRYRRNSPENSKKGAQAYESHLRSRLARGLPAEDEEEKKQSMTFKDFYSYWLKTYVEINNKPTTIRAKRMYLNRHLNHIIGKKNLEDICIADVERIKALKIKQGLSPKTVNNILSALSICMNTALELEYIEKPLKVKWLKVSDQPFDFLNEEECAALLNAADDVVVHDMVLCALRTGMRRGELLGLEWPSVDFARNIITIQQSFVEGNLHSTKNNRIRHIPMSIDLRTALLKRKQLKGFVFAKNGARPQRGIRANKWLYSLCKKAGMRRIGLHVLRHTFASHLVMRGVPMRAVQMLLGHSTIQMTERYTHLAPSALDQAIAVFDQPKIAESKDLWREHGARLGGTLTLQASESIKTA